MAKVRVKLPKNNPNNFAHPSVKKQRDTTKGHAKALVTGKGAKVVSAARTVKGQPIVQVSKSTFM